MHYGLSTTNGRKKTLIIFKSTHVRRYDCIKSLCRGRLTSYDKKKAERDKNYMFLRESSTQLQQDKNEVEKIAETLVLCTVLLLSTEK